MSSWLIVPPGLGSMSAPRCLRPPHPVEVVVALPSGSPAVRREQTVRGPLLPSHLRRSWRCRYRGRPV